MHCLLFFSLRNKCAVIAARTKRHYLHIFGIQLLVQWEALDNALITGVESTQLYPLVGRISASRAGEKSGMFFWWICELKIWHVLKGFLILSWLQMPLTALSVPRGLSFLAFMRCGVRWRWKKVLRVKAKTKTTPALAALKLELIIREAENDLSYCWHCLRKSCSPGWLFSKLSDPSYFPC